MQTTLLGLAIAFIIALLAALVGPHFIDWNQFRPQFEAEASRIIGASVRVSGKLDARLLPTPSLRLHSAVVGGANDLGKVRADKLDVEFSLGSLMRGEWRANELTIDGLSLDLGLDQKGRIDWPASSGSFNPATVAIERLNLTGRIAFHDAASRSTLELSDIAFSGDVRSLAGSVRGDGRFTVRGVRYPFRISSGQTPDGNGTRLHLNLDPAPGQASAELDGVLAFEARAPRFEGTVTLNGQGAQRGGSAAAGSPWRIAARVKADHAAARLDQIEVNYGVEERALKLAGNGDLRFGASLLLRAALSARQLDADRFVAGGNDAEPARAFPALRRLLSGIPRMSMPAQIELASEQMMLGGRPLQDISAEFSSDGSAWAVRRLDFRAPGATRVSLSGGGTQGVAPDSFKAALNVDSTDPDTLMVWLQGRGEVAPRNQKPLRLRADATVAPDGFTLDAMKAEIEGGVVEGRVALAHPAADQGPEIDAQLRSERLDLDAAAALVRSLAGPNAEWPGQLQLSLETDRAIFAGQELRPLAVKFSYDPKTATLERLRIGQSGGLTLQGTGIFDRIGATGKLSLDSSAASLGQLAEVIAPLAPAVAARLNAIAAGPGPARVKLALDVGGNAEQADRASLRAMVEMDSPQLKGSGTVTATPPVGAVRGLDLDALSRSEMAVTAKFSSPQGRSLTALLGLDRIIAVGDGPAQFEGSVNGAWPAALRLKGNIHGTGLDAEAEGSAEPWAQEAAASVNLKVRNADLGPLFDLKPSDRLARDIRWSSRLSLAGNRLTFDNVDGTAADSRLRGRLVVSMGDEKTVEGELGIDQATLAPLLALAIGAAGRDGDDPIGAGLMKGWRGNLAFQALHGALPGGGELQPVSGTLKSDGQSLTIESIKGRIGGGELTAAIDARPGANGIALNASAQFAGADGAALRYRNLSMPKGRVSMQVTLMSQGRSVAALTGALSGSGTVTLESAKVPGLDPRAFEVAVRAGDRGEAIDDARLKQLVDPVLSSGTLSVASAQIPFNIRDGRIRVGATTLAATGGSAVISGGYDIPADQADIRASLAPAMAGPVSSRPDIQLFAAGTPDALSRSIDVAALSSWLAVRAIDRETRRLDAIERGEPPPPPLPMPILIPPREGGEAPDASAAIAPPPDPAASRPPRRPPPKPRVSPQHPASSPPATSPHVVRPPAPVAGQAQLAPLPPPVDVKPAPKPRLRPPLSLTPQVANPSPRPAFQNSN